LSVFYEMRILLFVDVPCVCPRNLQHAGNGRPDTRNVVCGRNEVWPSERRCGCQCQHCASVVRRLLEVISLQLVGSLSGGHMASLLYPLSLPTRQPAEPTEWPPPLLSLQRSAPLGWAPLSPLRTRRRDRDSRLGYQDTPFFRTLPVQDTC
jgi:hypothetical protein